MQLAIISYFYSVFSPDSFAIKLPQFEGPFDLMLFFIERDELDIRDIPIARITQEFLAYIRRMERLNLEVASEFILFAATLMKIKARMLLPRPMLTMAGEEIDPREDLVRHLLEYKRFKEASLQLADMEQSAMARYPRAALMDELNQIAASVEDNAPLKNLNLTSIALAYQHALTAWVERASQRNHVVVAVPYTVEDQKAMIATELSLRPQVWFRDLLLQCQNRLQMVYTFMAILEMLNERLAELVQHEGINAFMLKRCNHA